MDFLDKMDFKSDNPLVSCDSDRNITVSDKIDIDTVVCKNIDKENKENEPTYYEKISLGAYYEPAIRETICNTYTKYSFQSMNAFGCILAINAIGCVLVANGIFSILCINSIGSFVSINSVFSIFSVNCAFCIGCHESYMCVSSN